MYKYKFSIGKEEIDAHIRQSISEDEKEMFKNIKFVPFDVHRNDNMDIEIIAVGVLDTIEEVKE